MSETVFILAGSNIGDREKYLTNALSKLECVEGLEIIATSAIYISDAQGMTSDTPSFMNQAVMGDYQYTANELLSALELVEKKLGRTDKDQNLSRTIDLDILLFGQQVIETDKLSIPHRELLNRPFAMIPILQIDPNIIHPVTKKPVANFLSEEDQNQVLLYKDHVARQP